MKKYLSFLLVIVVYLIFIHEDSIYAAPNSINPNASQEVNEVLEYFYNAQQQGKIISGQQLREYEHTEVNHVYNLTGKYPAIVGYDMIFSNDGTWQSVQEEREWIVQNATEHWNNGGLVTISWHQTNPLDPYPDVEGWDSLLTGMNQQQFNEMITPGTNLYNKWLNHVDMIAGYLKDLQNNGVVVIWRPYHEMNIGSFWWGDKSGQSYVQLWENMYNRFTNYHGLNNLIWVWAPDKGWQDPIDNTYYPQGFVDLGGASIYAEDRSNWAFQRDNDALNNVLSGKPYGITEVGLLPWTENMENAYNFSWFLTWTTQWLDNNHYGMPEWSGPGNSPWIIQEVYNHPMTITLDNLYTLQSGNEEFQQHVIPGKIEAEHYHGMYGVDIEETLDVGGGENIGWIDAGDWLDYEVNVNVSGTYTIEYRVASPNNGGQFELQSNYSEIDTLIIPNTGDWQNWQTITSTVYLEEGWHILRIYALDGGWNINWMNFYL